MENVKETFTEFITSYPWIIILVVAITIFAIFQNSSTKFSKVERQKQRTEKTIQSFPPLPDSEIPKAKEDLQFKILKKFLSSEECQELIDRAEPKFKRSRVIHKNDDKSVVKGRSSHSAAFHKKEFPLLDKIDKQTASLLNIDPKQIESLQMVKYKPGQEYRPHHDWFKNKDEPNQRHWTILVYLNDNYEGGETVFPKVDYSFKGKTGDAILWKNCQSNNIDKCFDHSLHAGTSPTTGVKYALNIWIRFKPYSK